MRSLCLLFALACSVMSAVQAASGYDPDITLTAHQSGVEIDPAVPVSGVVDVEVRIQGRQGQHAQFYANFRTAATLQGHIHGMIDSADWSRTLRIDTTTMYDGENLISVHAHPMNVAGERYQTEFAVGALKLITDNANPAPNGDTLLPTVELPPVITQTNDINGTPYDIRIEHWDPVITDDGPNGSGTVGRSATTDTPRQMIAHLGSSVLGRFRWGNQTPPFGDFELVDNLFLFPFQKDVAHEATIVLFISDGVGRANYGFASVTIPSNGEVLTTANAGYFPSTDARILNLHQGDDLVISPDGTVPVQIRLTNVQAVMNPYVDLTLWVGNRSVATMSRFTFQGMAGGADEVEVTLDIPGEEIAILEAARAGGPGASAFAVWLDFGSGQINTPVSEHIHMNSVRTTDLPWPYGEPHVQIMDPATGYQQIGDAFDIEYYFSGDPSLIDGVAWRLDGGPWTVDDGADRSISLSGLSRASHAIEIAAIDPQGGIVDGVTDVIQVEILNDPPIAVRDAYVLDPAPTLTVSPANGVLVNDQDLENDTLNATLVTEPSFGTVSLNLDGSFEYIPGADFRGSDTFVYRVDDGTDDGNTAPVLLVAEVDPAPVASSDAWDMYGNDARHSGQSTAAVGADPLTEMWRVDASFKGLTVVGRRVYASDRLDSGLVCLDRATGTEIWRLDWEENVNPPAYADGRLYVQTGRLDNHMLCVDAVDGTVLWEQPYQPRRRYFYAPTVAEGKVGVTGGGGVFTFPVDGSSNWFVKMPTYELWTPAIDDGKLYAFSGDTLKMCALADGAVIAERSVPTEWNGYEMETAPVLTDDLVLVRSNTGLYAYDRTDLTEAWRYEASAISQAPAVTADSVYLVDTGVIKRLSLADGSVLASADHGVATGPQPVVTSQGVLYTRVNAQTAVVDPVDLSLVQIIDVGGYEVVVAGSQLFIRQPNTLIALDSVAPVSPTAVMEVPVSVVDDDGDGQTTVVADAAASSAGGEPIEHYLWGIGETIVAMGVNPSIDLPLGTHELWLMVVGGDGLRDVAYATVQVVPGTGGSEPRVFHEVVTVADDGWLEVALPQIYADPVIIATPSYAATQPPVVTRTRIVAGDRIAVRVQNPSGVAVASSYDIHVLVVEAGSYTAEVTGAAFEAGHMTPTAVDYSSNWNAQSITPTQSYLDPVVIGQVAGDTQGRWSSFWARGTSRDSAPNASAIAVGHHVGEDGDVVRSGTQIDYIIIESGSGAVDGIAFTAGIGSDSVGGVGDGSTDYAIAGVGYPHAVLLSSAGMDGNDGGWPVLLGRSPAALSLAIDEDQIGDSERSHITEQVAYLVLDADPMMDRPPVASLSATPTSVEAGEEVLFDASGSSDDGAIIQYEFVFGDGNSVTTTSSSVTHRYVTDGDFEATVRVRDDSGQKTTSDPLTIEVRYPPPPLPGYDPDITFAVKKDGVAVDPTTPLSGVIEVEVTIANHAGQHAQFYTNMIPEPTVEDGTADGSAMISGSPFTRNLRIDTRYLYDGAHLISVHAHPMDHSMPRMIDFSVGAVEIRSANGNPAPSGDTELPTLTDLPASLETMTDSYRGTRTLALDPTIVDDVSFGKVAGSVSFENGIQMIAHLGTGVLGRMRWINRHPPFGDDELVNDAFLFPYQWITQRTGRVIIFFADAAGRCNYAFVPITIPAASPKDQEYIDHGPAPHARILGIEQGDRLVVPEEGLTLQVEVHDPNETVSGGFGGVMNLWVGNRVLGQATVQYWYDEVDPVTNSFVVDVTINHDQLRLIEQARDPGPSSRAMALWVDFSNGDHSFPNDIHTHLASIQTEGTVVPDDPQVFHQLVQVSSDAWTEITLPQSYVDPVVIATPSYAPTQQPVVTRTRIVGNDRIAVRVQNPSGAGVTGSYAIHCLVVEAGSYTAADHGATFEAGHVTPSAVDGSGPGWSGQPLTPAQSYISPVVLGQVAGDAQAEWSSFWARGASATDAPTATDLFIGHHVGEDSNTVRSDARLDYLIIEAGSGQIDGVPFTAGVGADTILGADDGAKDYAISEATPQSTVLLASAGMDGVNGGWPVLVDRATGSISLIIDEDQLGDSERSHTTEQVAWLAIAGEPLPPPTPPMTWSTTVADVGDGWQAVSLPAGFVDPVVLATVRYPDASAATCVTRLRNISASGLELRVQDPSGNIRSGYAVELFVIEAGVYTMAEHGFAGEARQVVSTLTDRKDSWQGQAYTYANAYLDPVVLTQVQTANDARWSSAWARGSGEQEVPDDTSCFVGKHIGEDTATSRADEVIGVVVIETGEHDLGTTVLRAGVGADSIQGMGNSPPYRYDLGAIDPSSVILASTAMDGNDGGWPVLLGTGAGYADLAIDEDTIGDSERSHTTEQVAWLAIAGEPLPPPTPPMAWSTTVVNVGDAWQAVSLPAGFVDPVVLATVRYPDASADTCVARLRNVGPNGLDLRVQDPAGQARGGYAVELFVIEAGVYTTAEHGFSGEARHVVSTITDRKTSWQGQSFSYANSYGLPVVLTQVQTANDPRWSVAWARGSGQKEIPDATTCAVGKHVGEDTATGRADETIGVVVIETGEHAIGPYLIQTAVGPDTVEGMHNSPPYRYDLGAIDPSSVILAPAAMDGGDGCWPILIDTGVGYADIAVDEDTIGDDERKHTTEQVGFLAIQDLSSNG